MLLWAVFTLGYILGVLIALLFLVKDEEQTAPVKSRIPAASFLNHQPTVIFRKLTQVNYR